jgi:phosphoglycolate phosphatase-like HAD superfamily hydrolase
MSLLHSVGLQFDIRLPIEKIWEFKRGGMTNNEALKIYVKNSKLRNEIQNSWKLNIESNYWLSYDRLFSDIYSKMHNLRKDNFNIYVISARSISENFKNQISNLRLDQLGIEFHCVSPNNKTYEKANILRQVNAKIYIGDSEADFESSIQAHVPFLGVACGQRSYKFLANYGIQKVFETTIDAINSLFDKINS